LAELLIVAQQVGVACRERGIPLVARGPATCTVALRLVEACPLDDGLDGEMFVHDGRPDLADLDLEAGGERSGSGRHGRDVLLDCWFQRDVERGEAKWTRVSTRVFSNLCGTNGAQPERGFCAGATARA